MTRTRSHFATVVFALLAGSGLCGVSGCSTTVDGPTVLAVDPDRYAEAFDAALETTDDYGFDAMLRDRRRGVIESEPLISPSAYEPWKTGHYSFEQVMENTVSLQRRRVRWEFAARAAPTEPDDATDTADLLGLDAHAIDLTKTTLPIELRVAVFIERAYSPGTRPRVWTTSDTTRAVIIDPQTGEPVERSFWAPVARDERFERQLLAAVRELLVQDAPTTDEERSVAASDEVVRTASTAE